MGNAIRNWPRLVKQCFDFTKPGGYTEFLDADIKWTSPDNSLPLESTVLKINSEFIKATRDAGMEPSPGPMLEAMVKDAGFTGVHHQRYPLPVGTWPADKHLVRPPSRPFLSHLSTSPSSPSSPVPPSTTPSNHPLHRKK